MTAPSFSTRLPYARRLLQQLDRKKVLSNSVRARSSSNSGNSIYKGTKRINSSVFDERCFHYKSMESISLFPNPSSSAAYTNRQFFSSEPVSKTLEEWNKTLQSLAKNGDLLKIQDSIDFINQNFHNQKLSFETFDFIFDAYMKEQQQVLKLLNLDVGEGSKIDDFNIKHINTLREAWRITNDADDFLQVFGGHRGSYLSPKHSGMIIEAWDRLLSAFDKVNADSDISNIINFKKKGIPQRATYHLEFMERMALNGINHSSPTVETYNSVLNIWERSQEHMRSLRAETIMQRIISKRENSHISDSSLSSADAQHILYVEPNAETYRIMIRTWCRNPALAKRKIGNAAFNATGYLMNMLSLMEKGHKEAEPTLDDYKMVFSIWAKAGYAKFAGKRALTLLKKMESLAGDDRNLTDVKPDVQCYKYVLRAMSESKAQYSQGLGYHAEDILSRMEENALVPDTDCFTYAIQTWCNAACRNNSTQKEIFQNATRAHELLDRMVKMHFRSGLVMVRPTTLDYNNVLRAWSKSSSKDAMQKVETLLSMMEKQLGASNHGIAPSQESYTHALRALSKTRETNMQVDGIHDLLLRMDKQYEEGNDACEPRIQCYNAAITVFGSKNYKFASDQQKQKALEFVINTLQKTRSKTARPNSRTYSLSLEAFSILLDRRSTEFKKVVESLFKRCCNEGLVDDKVIRTFHRVAPHEIYRRSVLVAASPDYESDGTQITETLFLPEEWTRNIDGIRQRTPLAVDGRFVRVRSQSISEHKMRRLRKRQNKSLLQGGRM